MRSHPRSRAWLLAATLGLALAACGQGEVPDENTCSTPAECPRGEVCLDGLCVEEPAGFCETGVDCPGAQTCDQDTHLCEGDCCDDSFCPKPSEQCDEALCLKGLSAPALCVPLACEPACGEGFTCDLFAEGGPACLADCLVDRCEGALMCDPVSGACVDRLPVTGEVGAACATPADCGEGMVCRSDLPGGYCSFWCQEDQDCPSGSFCGPGFCVDRCSEQRGDCGEGQLCWGPAILGKAGETGCFPLLPVSTCESGCLPEGAECDPEAADRCPAGSTCLQFIDGPAVCQTLQCHQPGRACGEGFECRDLGGFTSCHLDCDGTDPDACSALGMSCKPGVAFVGARQALRQVPSADDCREGEGVVTADLGTGPVALCHVACTTDAQCGPGMICETLHLTSTLSVDTCVHYNRTAGTCAGGACDSSGCIDLGGSPTEVSCFAACATDADCDAAPFGECKAYAFAPNKPMMRLCVYENTDNMCWSRCTADTGCGYCHGDADCATGEACDFDTHTCAPLPDGTTCPSRHALEAGGILKADGTLIDGCARPCASDDDCKGTCARAAGAATGFCVPPTFTCNAVGQCEKTCESGAACYHGLCEPGVGPDGENVCASP